MTRMKIKIKKGVLVAVGVVGIVVARIHRGGRLHLLQLRLGRVEELLELGRSRERCQVDRRGTCCRLHVRKQSKIEIFQKFALDKLFFSLISPSHLFKSVRLHQNVIFGQQERRDLRQLSHGWTMCIRYHTP
jgi:hypothetical protein